MRQNTLRVLRVKYLKTTQTNHECNGRPQRLRRLKAGDNILHGERWVKELCEEGECECLVVKTLKGIAQPITGSREIRSIK